MSYSLSLETVFVMYKEHLREQELGTKGHSEKQKRHTILEPWW